MIKISKIKYQKSNIKNGFTLVELLAVTFLFITIGTIIVIILFSSLRGTNKTKTITTVRDNGNYAISLMSKMIRNAKKINYISGCVSSSNPPSYSALIFTSLDGGQTTFACCPAGANPVTIASISGSMTCNSSNRISLIDTDNVSVVSCSFTCDRNYPSDYPTINIKFSLNRNSTSSLVENIASATAIPFETSVQMRNLSK